MITVELFVKEFYKNPFLGILRGLPPEQVQNCVLTCKNANLKFIEVPLNTKNAAVALKELCNKKQNLIVGAGTVITERDLQTALECGAEFIVTPILNENVVKECSQKNVPCIIGALTPTEIIKAYTLGATVIKVFPVSSIGGAKYIKELRGPFKNVPLLACGGVKKENVKDFFKAGCDFVSFGASIFSVENMEKENWKTIEEEIKALTLA